ncbi:ABC transporter ATP-binding protein [Desulfobacca acetoxidans]|uniref:Phosphonate-transporting ATPase n=1 Tax=Desulfobacca acetoxidans (strain ATCC 700848 / DSM 11109 / ASRB2) TaxID=880072 RepID=F2NIQ9_DESAR|nr:ABC transporter ATP-binding protein [Desulfobacca acetoxidans]AEB10534.1 Phosphonate-transporting ATPase [Desulfobacca acetoxidans DSM 11109]
MITTPGLRLGSQIRLENLIKTFTSNGNRVEVLKGVDLEIMPGDSLAIVGASGVGKSTLLHIIGALERPTAGRLLWGEEEIFTFNDEQLAAFRNRKIGFVFQFHHLLPEFNALENVMLPGLIARLAKSEAQDRAEAILQQVGLQERLRHRIGALSGGEQQRVAVARALVMNPDVLLADEPTGNLDPRIGRQIHELLIGLNREKRLTTVVVTHNLELAELLGNQITIREGKVVRLSQDHN